MVYEASPPKRRIHWIAVIILLIAFAFVLLSGFSKVRYGEPLYTCYRQMHVLAKGIIAYRNEHGHYPPPYILDSTGKPMHSWRILILPYIAEAELYDKYDFDEPWDGPNNSRLASSMPAVFHCPGNSWSGSDSTTSYLAVIGNDTAWNPDANVSIDDIADGAQDTVLLAEYARSDIHWMEPRDVSIDDTVGENSYFPASHHDDGDWVIAYADGYVEVIDDLPLEVFRAMLTVAGGESIDPTRIKHR